MKTQRINARNRYKAIIYDIDGTILNTLNMNMYPLIQIIREETGEEWTFEKVLKFVPYTGMAVMEELGIKDKEAVYARWVRYVNEYPEGAVLYEGFDQVFEAFRQAGILQAVVSAKTREQYAIDMVSKGLHQYMSAAVLAEDTQKHKPDPEPLLKCLERLGISPEEALYIGDTYSDYAAAGNAGVDFGYARWGSVSSEGILAPDWEFDHPQDLLRLIRAGGADFDEK